MKKKTVNSYQGALRFLLKEVDNTLSGKRVLDDIVGYYKIPYSLFITGQISRSYKFLTFCIKEFWQKDFFSSKKDLKSFCPYMREFSSYVDGWLIVPALFHGMISIVMKNYNFLLKNYYKKNIGFSTQSKSEYLESEFDLITLAHMGYVSLYLNRFEIAKENADSILHLLKLQPHLDNCFYLRFNSEGDLIKKDFQKEEKFYVINNKIYDQDYFHLGYGALFLVVMYSITNDIEYIEGADRILDFAFSCKDDVFTKINSGKIFRAGILYTQTTKDPKFLSRAMKIFENLIESQCTEGYWNHKACNSDNTKNYAYTLDITSENLIWIQFIIENYDEIRNLLQI